MAHVFQQNFLITRMQSKERVYLKGYSDCTRRSLFLIGTF